MNRTELMTDRQTAAKKAQYWLDLAVKHTHRNYHYQALCTYKTAAQYFFELQDREQLRKIFKERPDVQGLLSAKIVEFCDL